MRSDPHLTSPPPVKPKAAQPVRSFGVSHLDRSESGVQTPVAVATQLSPAVRPGLAVLGAAHRVSIDTAQSVDHGLYNMLRIRSGQAYPRTGHRTATETTMGGAVTVDILSKILWKVDSNDQTATGPTPSASKRPPADTPLHRALLKPQTRDQYPVRAPPELRTMPVEPIRHHQRHRCDSGYPQPHPRTLTAKTYSTPPPVRVNNLDMSGHVIVASSSLQA